MVRSKLNTKPNWVDKSQWDEDDPSLWHGTYTIYGYGHEFLIGIDFQEDDIMPFQIYLHQLRGSFDRLSFFDVENREMKFDSEQAAIDQAFEYMNTIDGFYSKMLPIVESILVNLGLGILDEVDSVYRMVKKVEYYLEHERNSIFSSGKFPIKTKDEKHLGWIDDNLEIQIFDPFKGIIKLN